jgi:FlaA1/EpsC-like NDP-sugar epimerase
VYTGLRPGEKLYEELLASNEDTISTPHEKLRIALGNPRDSRWLTGLIAWLDRPDLPDEDNVKRDLAAWVPEYRPSGLPAPPRAAAGNA